MGAEKDVVEVKFGASRVFVKRRENGWFHIYWREAGRPRSTTRVDRNKALEFARKKVRELSPQQGGKILTIEDARLVERLKGMCGPRSPFSLLDQLEHATKRWGWDCIGRSLRHYEDSGLAEVKLVPVKQALGEMVEWYTRKRDKETTATIRKEIAGFCRLHEVMVADLTNKMVELWVDRRKEDGEEIEARTFNNRINAWRTFLNWCREENYWPKGEKHPGEMVKRERVAGKLPEIWTVETTARALDVVLEHKPKLLNCLVIGCWLGLRPEESKQIAPEAWDWHRGYVNVGADVATKLEQQRFVPIKPNVRAILGGVMADPRDRLKTGGNRKMPMCTGTDDIIFLSALLRKHKVIEEWIPDVMRHSYISYQIALGHGLGQVAEWAGNSEREIRKKYRRPLMREDGERYFSIGLKALEAAVTCTAK